MSTRAYWLALRGYLAIWGLVNVVGMGLLSMYGFRQTEMSDQRTQLMQQLTAIQQKAARYANYQQDVAFFQARHLHWQQQILQPDYPGHWASAWSALQQQEHLPHMQYEIQPAISCDPRSCAQFWPGTLPSGPAMLVTSVKLRWSVPHESDVLYWLQQLHQSYAGRMLLRGCQWSATGTAESIAAECEVYWFDFPNLAPGQPA